MGNKTDRKKELMLEYKERKLIGGIYIISNTANGKYLLLSDVNIKSVKNRFEFSQSTNSCVMPKLQKDWKEFGNKVFTLEILEELEKKETQTDKEFKEDLDLIVEVWAEKYDESKSYFAK